MTNSLKLTLLRVVFAAATAIAIFLLDGSWDSESAIYVVPVLFVISYVLVGVAFFFIDLVWTLLTKPDERLFAMNMLSGAVLVTTALGAGYWLIHGSIGLVATFIYVVASYCIFLIVRWFRRHTASYYAALEAEQRDQQSFELDQDKLN